MAHDKKASHLGVGILVGSLIGIGAAAFLQTKTGKQLSKDAHKKAIALQKKVTSELSKAGELTKARYDDIVDSIVAYYVKTKDIAVSEIPVVKKTLYASWKSVEKELKKLGN